MKKEKPLVLISSCILGEKVRFNGGHTRLDWVTEKLTKYVDFLPICPEMAMGMGTPREQIHIEYKKGEQPKLIGRSGKDYSESMNIVLDKYAIDFKDREIDGIILQSKSPSCGVERVKHRNQETGIPDKFEAGVFGQFFIDNFPHTPIFDSGRLHDEQQRHIFLNKLFAYFRFRQNVKTVGDLQAFHKEYKYLLMGYNQNTMREMGRIAANGGDFNIYLEKLMTLLSSRISKKNIINSLYHMMGYLKKDLDLSDKEHIHSLIEDYSKQNSYENKVEPILNFLIEKYDIAYLKEQRFFNPYPKELADVV